MKNPLVNQTELFGKSCAANVSIGVIWETFGENNLANIRNCRPEIVLLFNLRDIARNKGLLD